MPSHSPDRPYDLTLYEGNPIEPMATERPSDEMTDEEVEAWTKIMGAPPKSRSLKPIGHVEFGFQRRR